jgi:hypothetical protein
LETGLVTLATRWPSLTLAGDGAAVTWDYETFRGIVSLPVVLCG